MRIKGLTFADLEQCKAASAVVVTCEEIVPDDYLRLDPDHNALPPFLVDAVVPVPYGAHPTACPYFYDYDPQHLNLYKAAAKDDDAWAAYLDEWVYGVESWDAYLDKVGGAQLARIRRQHRVRLRARAWTGGERDERDDARGRDAARPPASRVHAREMMAIAAGRFIKDGDMLFAGTGVAMLAAIVAKRIHAPHAHIFFETGGIGPPLEELPMAVADPRVMAVRQPQRRARRGVQLRRQPAPAHDRLPRRRADRPLRQHELDRHRRLPPPEGALRRQRRRLRRRLAGAAPSSSSCSTAGASSSRSSTT